MRSTLLKFVIPAQAIFSEDDLSAEQAPFLVINADLAKDWPVITEKKDAPADAEEWDGKPGKRALLER